jgi:hypothetical protein
MAKALKKVRVASNPHRKPAKKSRPNAAPKKGSHKHHMAKNKKRNKAASHRRKPNPMMGAAKHHKRRKSRNPMNLGIGSAKEIVVSAIAGLGSAVATVQLPQLILQANNTGWMGYLANIGTGIAATLLAAGFAGPTAGKAAMVGAAVIVLDRILTEQFSSIGPYLQLSGVGDATQHHRMGTIRDGYFLHPTMQDGSGNMIVPDPVTQAAIAAVLAKYPQIAAPMAQAMQTGGSMGVHAVNPSSLRRHTASGQLLSSRFQSRFNQSLN